MTNYILTFEIENTTFSSDEKWTPLLRFSINYTIEFSKEDIFTFRTPFEFNPKTKELIFSEYTLGKGFSNTVLKIEQLWDLHNPLKSVIVEPSEKNQAGNWLNYWNGAQGEKFQEKEKLNTYIAWWKENFDSIKEEILKNKENYNQQITALYSRSLID
jgi:hypothetical protein